MSICPPPTLQKKNLLYPSQAPAEASDIQNCCHHIRKTFLSEAFLDSLHLPKVNFTRYVFLSLFVPSYEEEAKNSAVSLMIEILWPLGKNFDIWSFFLCLNIIASVNVTSKVNVQVFLLPLRWPLSSLSLSHFHFLIQRLIKRCFLLCRLSSCWDDLFPLFHFHTFTF